MDDIATRVARGTALLDEKFPGWFAGIDLSTLSLSSCHLCVLGQVFSGHVSDDERSQLIAQVVAKMGSTDGVQWHACVRTWGGYSILTETLELESGGVGLGFQAGTEGGEYELLLEEWTRVVIEKRLQAHPDVRDLTMSLAELREPVGVA